MKFTQKFFATGLALLCAASIARGERIYGIGTTGADPAALSLFSFDTSTPNTVSSLTPITGVTSGFSLVGIDFRSPFMGNPNGQLYAFGYNTTSQDAQVFTLNITTGVATAVGSAFAIGSASGATGDSFGFDFNSTVDRIRVVTGNQSNFRVNPNNGQLVMFDGDIAYAPGDPTEGANEPQISGSAYLGSTLYGIDYANNVLVMQDPNAGTLTTIGDLGIVTLGPGTMGFDISPITGTAFLSTDTDDDPDSDDELYMIDLTSGAATLVGQIGPDGLNTYGIAAVPEPSTWISIGIGAAMLLALKRRRRS